MASNDHHQITLLAAVLDRHLVADLERIEAVLEKIDTAPLAPCAALAELTGPEAALVAQLAACCLQQIRDQRARNPSNFP